MTIKDTDSQPHTSKTANSMIQTLICELCYLCCDRCPRQRQVSILDSRSTSLWSCTAHTPGCTSGDGCSSPLPHTSCCWSPDEAPGDKNTRRLSRVPQCTGDCSPLWPHDTDLLKTRSEKKFFFYTLHSCQILRMPYKEVGCI